MLPTGSLPKHKEPRWGCTDRFPQRSWLQLPQFVNQNLVGNSASCSSYLATVSLPMLRGQISFAVPQFGSSPTVRMIPGETGNSSRLRSRGPRYDLRWTCTFSVQALRMTGQIAQECFCVRGSKILRFDRANSAEKFRPSVVHSSPVRSHLSASAQFGARLARNESFGKC